MAQRLDNLEDDRVAQRRIRHLELALAHDALSQLARVEFTIRPQMPQANVGDLALLEEAVADDVLSAFLLAALDQTDHSVDVSKVVPRLRDLGLVGGNDTADLGTLLLQRLDDERIGHAALKSKSPSGRQPRKWCSCSIMPSA